MEDYERELRALTERAASIVKERNTAMMKIQAIEEAGKTDDIHFRGEYIALQHEVAVLCRKIAEIHGKKAAILSELLLRDHDFDEEEIKRLSKL